MTRPTQLSTRVFKRTLSDTDVAILAAAGEGDTSIGFKVLLSFYQRLYNAGIKTDDDLITLLTSKGKKK
jgi:hypothetical protein